jgi:20S proteasome subunit beta 2
MFSFILQVRMPRIGLILLLATVLGLHSSTSGDILPPPNYFSPWDSCASVDNPRFSSFTKTGTTIVGLRCAEGVVLGADTRSTGGPLVMDKDKLKIHTIASRIFCCAAGTSADCDQISRRARHQLALLRLERELCGEDFSFDPIKAALISISTALESSAGGRRKPSSVMILGGVDDDGPALYIVDESKVPQKVNFAALGSGSTDAIALLENARQKWQRSNTHSVPSKDVGENRFIEDIDIATAIDAVRQAVHAGITNDLGSGSHIDICVIEKKGVRQWRESLSFERGQQTSSVIKRQIQQLDISSVTVGEEETIRVGDVNVVAAQQANYHLGDIIYSRSKLPISLLRSNSNECFIERCEEIDARPTDLTLCDVQKI